jgi:excisionase family DNA binding protein
MSGLASALLAELTEDDLDTLARRLAGRLPVPTAGASPWLSVAEAAERMRCKPDRVYDLIQLGKLTPRRDGRRVLLRVVDIDAYLEGGS